MSSSPIEFLCPECDEVQEFEKLEAEEEGDQCMCMCMACGHEVKHDDIVLAQKYKGFVVGVIESVEKLKGKLSKVAVNVGNSNEEEGPLAIVTNAKYIAEGDRVVVATIGAIVPAGASLEDDGDSVEVKKSSVGGSASYGILCDAPMLAWPRGTKGQLVKLPETYEVGSLPPVSDPSK